MDRLDAMALFVAAAEEGSLAAAGRRHGRSPATVTRAVALLERSAGEQLLRRSTRQLSLTPAGERHVAVWREVLSTLADIAPDVGQAPLRGTLIITAPEMFGRLKLLPLVEAFLGAHPDVSVRLLLMNRVANLMGEGIDLALRLAPLPSSTLTAVKLGEVRALLCASPEYLAGAGTPESPDDLPPHACIGLNAGGEGELWPFSLPAERGARARSVRVAPRLSIDNAEALVDTAVRGNGIILARSYQVDEHLASGRLVRLLPRFETPGVPAHFVYPGDRARRGIVRAFVDHAAGPLRRELQAGAERLVNAPGSGRSP